MLAKKYSQKENSIAINGSFSHKQCSTPQTQGNISNSKKTPLQNNISWIPSAISQSKSLPNMHFRPLLVSSPSQPFFNNPLKKEGGGQVNKVRGERTNEVWEEFNRKLPSLITFKSGSPSSLAKKLS
ncbi:hypothetical protein TNCV_592491 [Trichonephila clavipes]|nr:hypothetical protein TNCV_592491 [Trichonephila clavipes]